MREMLRLSLAVVVLCALTGAACAGVPPVISYQGKLMQPSGAPVADGSYSIQFLIYDAPTGGTPVWSQVIPTVQTKGGLFSVLLADVPASVFDSPERWFAVKVGSDPEMTPRQKIASVGYAVKAGSADVAATVPDRSITGQKLATGTITADLLAPGVAIPPGTILMWSGAVNQVPQGWALCDGQNGTPDLGSRFIVGAGGVDSYAVGATGGEKLHRLTKQEMPSHTHDVFTTWMISFDGNRADVSMGSDLNWGGHLSPEARAAGGDQPHENRPPYYALCFIMKLGY